MGSSERLLRDVRLAIPSVLASADAADRVSYARDLWPRHHIAVRAGNVAEHRPGVIVWPRSTAEVAAVVRWAGETRPPLLPFGAGSGVCARVPPPPNVVVGGLKRTGRLARPRRRAP